MPFSANLKRRVSRETLLEVIDREPHLTLNALSDRLGITRYGVLMLFIEYGLQLPQRLMKSGTTVAKERLEELLAQGMSCDQIQRELGISNRTLRMALAVHGLSPNLSEQQILGTQGLRRCGQCDGIKTLGEFYMRTANAGAGKYEGRCKQCSVLWLSVMQVARREEYKERRKLQP